MASPELRKIIEMLAGRPPGETQPLDQYRAGLDAMTAAFPVPPDVQRDSVRIGGVQAAWLAAPGARPGRVLLHLHGGAYVRGSMASHGELVARMARACGARGLLPAYRLAPEHPYPAALDDALAVYRALLADGVDPAALILSGDSAGGGLALATLVALREAGDPLPALAVLLSPWTDLAGTGESVRTKAAVDPFVGPRYLHVMAAHYLGGAPADTPGASPLYADLHGLPALMIQVGTAEVLLDDSIRVADKARAAGTPVTLEQWPDMVHVWHFFAQVLPEGKAAVDRLGEWVRAQLDG